MTVGFSVNNSGLFQACEDDGYDTPVYAGSRYYLYHWFNSGTIVLVVASSWHYGSSSGSFNDWMLVSFGNGDDMGSVLRYHFQHASITKRQLSVTFSSVELGNISRRCS